MHRQDSFAMQDNNDDEENTQHFTGKSESDEEDYESFFLQPATSPYNIKDKINEANAQLVQTQINDSRLSKVKFREDLVDFEPDLTDDDVQSIESYTEEVINVNEELKYVLDNNLCNIIEEEIIEESIFETIIELNHQKQCAEEDDAEIGYSTPEESNEIEEIGNIEEVENIEEVIEEIDDIQSDIDSGNEINEKIDFIIEDSFDILEKPPVSTELEKVKSLARPSQDSNTESMSSTPKSSVRKKKSRAKNKRQLPNKIDCKKHCVQELESRLEHCINNLRLNENITKPVCPTLRLHRQKCCSGGCKIEQKLPLYTGVHSEYGLSSTQIERLARHKECIKLKEMKEREVAETYRRRKIQQNETIYRQWLKDITARRNVERERKKEIISKTASRTTSRGRHSSGESTQCTTARIESAEQKRAKQERQQKVPKARPKTANCITSLHLQRKPIRPHTTSSSTARIYIEVPEHLLDEGLQLGELFIRQLDFRSGHRIDKRWVKGMGGFQITTKIDKI